MNKLGIATVLPYYSEAFFPKVVIPPGHILMQKTKWKLKGWEVVGKLIVQYAMFQELKNYFGGLEFQLNACYSKEEAENKASEFRLKLNLLALRISEIKITEGFGNFVVLDGEEFIANCVSKAHAELIKQDLIEKL